MASTTFYSNHALSFSPTPRATRMASRNATLTPSVRIPPSRSITPGFPALSSVTFSRRPFRASFKVAESDPKTITEEEDSQLHRDISEDKEENLSTMKDLIQVYKKAIQNGDEKVSSDVEAMICTIEKEKNDLFSKVGEITADVASGKDKFLRLNADFENFRKRSEKDRLNFSSDIQGELVENLLPMVDSFEKAKQQIKPETEKEKKIDTSYQGIYKQFVETLRGLRVSVVETVGKQFDPSVHEAVARVESDQFRDGIVIQEVRRGFLLGERLLRPATVKVSSGPGVKKAPPSVEKSAEQPPTAAKPDDDPIHVSDSS